MGISTAISPLSLGGFFMAGKATACTEVTLLLSELQINCEQSSRSPGAQSPIASLATWSRYARELHLVMSPVPDDHNLVTLVHQLEVGEKSSAPGTDTTRGLSCRSGGEAYGCLLLPELISERR